MFTSDERPFAGACRAFCLDKDIYPLPNVYILFKLQEGERSFPVQPLRSPCHFVWTPGPGLSFFWEWEHATTLLCARMSCTSKSSEFELHLLYAKNLRHSAPPQFCDLRGFLVNPMQHSLNLSPSLSLFSPHKKGSHSSIAWQLFSPPFHFHTPYTCHIASSNCRNPSWNPQIDFLGVPSDRPSIQLRSRDEESLRAPYLSAILEASSGCLNQREEVRDRNQGAMIQMDNYLSFSHICCSIFSII